MEAPTLGASISSSESSSSSSPPASAGGQYRRKPSRNFPGLVRRSHMGSLASIVTSRPYNRSASVTSANNRPRRPSSLHIPVTQTRSASSAMVSPILTAATRAIHKNLEATSAASGLPFPPLIFPSAEFDPHLMTQSRNGTKGNKFSNNFLKFVLYMKLKFSQIMKFGLQKV